MAPTASMSRPAGTQRCSRSSGSLCSQTQSTLSQPGGVRPDAAPPNRALAPTSRANGALCWARTSLRSRILAGCAHGSRAGGAELHRPASASADAGSGCPRRGPLPRPDAGQLARGARPHPPPHPGETRTGASLRPEHKPAADALPAP